VKRNIQYHKGFTLIELLVVIAIIGVLASVVLASLNTARAKGSEVAIKSNLKNIIPQAELTYDAPGNYSLVCADTKVASMLTAINNAGGTTSCSTYDNTRWGVSVKLDSDDTKKFSVDPIGVVVWDTADKSLSIWDTAVTKCASTGGHLPSLEQLKALQTIYGGTPTGFTGSNYWSGTMVPTNNNNAYYVNMSTGAVSNALKGTNWYVRCVH